MAIIGNYQQNKNLQTAYIKLNFISSYLETDGTSLLGRFYYEIYPNEAIRLANRTAVITDFILLPIMSDSTALYDGYEALKIMPEYSGFIDC